jgi:hypothetical protein
MQHPEPDNPLSFDWLPSQLTKPALMPAGTAQDESSFMARMEALRNFTKCRSGW